MRATVLLLTLASGSLLTLAAADIPTLPPEENTITIIMHFEEEYAPSTLKQMQQELEFILRPWGLTAQWRFVEEDYRGQLFAHLVVARFRGVCALSETSKWDYTSGALGATDLSEGKVIPYCKLDCSRIQNFIRPAVADESFQQAQLLLGRAMGRVLAHELFHILADTKQHGRDGVTKQFLRPEELVDGVLAFERSDGDLLRKKLIGSEPDEASH